MEQTISPENWNVIKSVIHRRWDEISDEELEATHGDQNAVIDLLAGKYHIDHDEAESRFEAALAEEHDHPESIEEVRRAEIRFESDGGRVLPSFEDLNGDLREMKVPSETRH